MKLNEISTVVFDNNTADHNGGSAFLEINSHISFEEWCTVTFYSNMANDGTEGAIFIDTNSAVEFKDNSTVKFYNNSAVQGGAIYSSYNSRLIFSKNTAVTFIDNVAAFGGAINCYRYSFVTYHGGINSIVIFNNNKATQNGESI